MVRRKESLKYFQEVVMSKKKDKDKEDKKEIQAFKFEIFPTKEQEEYLIENQKACSTFFNCGLKIAISQYKIPIAVNYSYRTSISFSVLICSSFSILPFEMKFDSYLREKKTDFLLKKVPFVCCGKIRDEVNKLKKTEKYKFLNKAYSQSLNNMIYGNEGNLDNAFKKFFKDHTGYPNFKKKYQYKDISLYLPEDSFSFDVEGEENFVVIPLAKGIKIDKRIKIIVHRRIAGKVKSARISSNNTDRFFISFTVERELSDFELKENKAIGIDYGLKHFATITTGEKIDNPKYYQNKERQLKKLNKKKDKKAFKKCNTCKFVIPFKDKINHKIKNCPTCKTPLVISKNYEKAKNQISKHGEKIKNQRNDFLQKQSTELIRNNNLVVLENLSMKNMSKNKKLSKALLDTGWSEFVKMLEYKGKWNNCKVVKIDRFYASSKICHNCGYKNKELKLSQRIWICPNCKAELDRDFNAALNILFKYLSGILIQSVLSQNPCNINYVLNFLNINKVGGALPDFKPAEKSTSGIELKKFDFIRSSSGKQEMSPVREQLLLFS
jgi:putative transposase